jgi:hypothetical protein
VPGPQYAIHAVRWSEDDPAISVESAVINADLFGLAGGDFGDGSADQSPIGGQVKSQSDRRDHRAPNRDPAAEPCHGRPRNSQIVAFGGGFAAKTHDPTHLASQPSSSMGISKMGAPDIEVAS